MADPDDIDKLLREIDAMNASGGKAGSSGSTGPSAAASPVPSSAGSGPSKSAWVGTAAVGGAAAGGVAGMLLPWLGMFQSGIGAAIGGAVVALASTPPAWFTKRR